MKKLDLKKELASLYRPSAKKISIVDVPRFRFLMVDGQGAPGSPDFQEAVQALYSVSYAAKFHWKRSESVDYAVMPLEGLWWADDPEVFKTGDKDQWQWTMMILQPDFLPDETIHQTLEQVREKKRLPGLDRLRLEAFTEGRCAQTLHVGPFAEEGPVIERMHAFIHAESGLRGKHHEIYLTDIRRADPAKWKTILRQPMQ